MRLWNGHSGVYGACAVTILWWSDDAEAYKMNIGCGLGRVHFVLMYSERSSIMQPVIVIMVCGLGHVQSGLMMVSHL